MSEEKKYELQRQIEARLKAMGLLQREGKTLDRGLVREFEPILGKEVKDVRVHTGPQAARLTQSVGARALAFNTGDIYFAPGEFQPHDPTGKALIAHELTHVAEGHVGASGPAPDKQKKEDELKARAVEQMVLAKERKPPKKQKKENAKEPIQVDFDSMLGSVSAVVDKYELEEKTYEVIQKLLHVAREREGRF